MAEIHVPADGGNRGDLFQLAQDLEVSHVTTVQNMVAAVDPFEHLGP